MIAFASGKLSGLFACDRGGWKGIYRKKGGSLERHHPHNSTNRFPWNYHRSLNSNFLDFNTTLLTSLSLTLVYLA
jgi:hypothetical protein